MGLLMTPGASPPRLWLLSLAALCTIGALWSLLAQTSHDQSRTTLTTSSSSARKNTEAYVTLLTSKQHDDRWGRDPYYNSTRMLVFQLLNNPGIKDAERDVVVLINDHVDKWKRDQLSRDGAIVKLIKDVPLNFSQNEKSKMKRRYENVYNKLRIWEMEEYKRIMFIDADTLIIRPLKELWTHSSSSPQKVGNVTPGDDEAKKVEGDVKSDVGNNYILSAYRDRWMEVSQKMGEGYFNAGMMILQPSKAMYKRLERLIPYTHLYKGVSYPEQNLLNWVFRQDGPMPWKSMPHDRVTKYVTPHKKDIDKGLLVVHWKWWQDEKSSPYITKLGERLLYQMEGFYMAKYGTAADVLVPSRP